MGIQELLAVLPTPHGSVKVGGCHLAPGATELQLCFGSLKALSVLRQQFAVMAGDATQLSRGPRGSLLLPTDKG